MSVKVPKVYEPKRNWARMFDDLNAEGLRDKDIADAVEISASQIVRYRTDTEPGHNTGVRIEKLHCLLCLSVRRI